MPIIKFVNEDENIEYAKEQDLCSLLCYAFDSEKTEFQGHRLVGCKPFGFPQEYMTNPLAVHEFMEFNHKRQYKYQGPFAKHRVISFTQQECLYLRSLKSVAENIISFYADRGYVAAYAVHRNTKNYHIHIIVDMLSYQDLTLFHMSRGYEASNINAILNVCFQQYFVSKIPKYKTFKDRTFEAVPIDPSKIENFFEDVK